ncbi:hypothetical protein [Castellaniella sp. S9]|uniref:hypothetical protein n=1 Tax=Castellaniella sp. S9 TaxID=2993652 RepID=UPI0022B3F707|nr:hypothetical protein [Castellaniella sp. S9]
MSSLPLFPARIAIGQFSTSSGGRQQTVKVQMTPEFYRALQLTLQRLGGPSSEIPTIDEIFLEATMASPLSQDAQEAAMMLGDMVQASRNEATGDVFEAVHAQAPADSFQAQEPAIFQPQGDSERGEATFQVLRIDGSPLAPQALTVTASPMTITADRRCAIHVDGPVDSLTFSRAGVNLDVSGNLIELNLGDTLTVAYTSAPTLTLIPR